MGSSTTGKKHKKEKKHKHRSIEEDVTYDLTRDEESSVRRHHKHKKHKEHSKERRRHKHRERDRQTEVIAVQESESDDSSDCVEVPVDLPASTHSHSSSERENERTAPPPPQLSSKYTEREKERGREREYERAREKEREREREKERDRERERERYEREREMERRREREMIERERYERERERERNERGERDRVERGERAERGERGERGERNERERHHQYRDRSEQRNEREQNKRERERERDTSNSPIPENGAGDSLSIEETNKLRAKLGLKPLEVDSGPSTSSAAVHSGEAMKRAPGEKDLSAYKDEWGEFLHKPADNLKEKAKAEKIREKLKQCKEKRFLEERLAHIRTLGESDDEADDVSKWVERNKRAVDMKKEAAKREKALEEMDAEFGVDDLVEQEKADARRKAYSDKHLRGLRVDHDMEDFSEGKTIILTLKDKGVLDEAEGDALVNVNMIDDERYKRNVVNRKQNPLSYGYNVYEEQYDELGNPIERSILEKYDEDLDGKKIKQKNFVIGENMEEQREHRRKILEIKTKLAGKRLETLADTRIQLASDTYSEVELTKFKKPKKKVKKIRQKLKAGDLLPLNDEPMQQNFGSRRGRQRVPDGDNDDEQEENTEQMKYEEEDEDLERVLSKARKLKQKENIIKKPLPADIEVMIKQEVKTEPSSNDAQNGADDSDTTRGADGNIILNATAEFCRTLGDIPTYGMAGNRDEDSNDMMDYEVNDTTDERTGNQFEEPELNHGTWNSVNPDEVMRPADLDDIVENVEEVAILDEEPDVGAGVANALRLALSKGYLEKEEHNRPSNSKMAHLQAKNYSIEDKAAGEDDKFGRRDRFHAGPIMDFKDKDTFKPNVKLEYIDDNGRILNLKEAFRYLSHKFHGKGPGKNKIEKRLKKMEQDGLMKTMSSTDTPLGTLTMLQQKQKETKTPYVVLSGGKQSTASVTNTTISKYK